MTTDFSLLRALCSIHAPSGDEVQLTRFLLDYIKNHKKHWKTEPEVYAGKGFQDCIVLKFGQPKTAIFAHIDSIGFTVKYGAELIKVGGPVSKDGILLVGEDREGSVECTLNVIQAAPGKKHGQLEYTGCRPVRRGTNLTFKPVWRETDAFVQCCYMDNRLGVWNALKVAETLENGVICFSCWEEHGGGSVEYLARFIYEKFGVHQALISDITWVTEGIHHGNGCVISIRDSGLPRRSYVNRIISIAEESGISFQLEVEGTGGSDGNALQRSPYPFDWCFIGAPENHVHSPDEKVHKADIASMVALYKRLMEKL